MLNEIGDDVLCEAGNVILNGFVATLADALHVDLDSKTPTMQEDLPRHEWMSDQDGEVELFFAEPKFSPKTKASARTHRYLLLRLFPPKT